MSPEEFFVDADIMRRYRHKNLLSLYGICSIDFPLLIITEYMCNGSLRIYLREHSESPSLTFNDFINMASQVASGMAYLEQVK